jgi:hypothetical protein
MTIPTETRIDPATGEAAQKCSRCGDWWPLTSQFYYPQRSGKFAPTCIACYLEASGRGNGRGKKSKVQIPERMPVRKGVEPPRRWERTIGGLHCTAAMFMVLQSLVEAGAQGFPYIPLPGVHKHTLNALTARRWIIASPGLDGWRYAITDEGRRAHKIFSRPPNRNDGICPVCGIRPKHRYPSGKLYGYCKECEAEHKKAMYHLGRTRLNPDRLCSCCHQRPLHRMSGGRLSTYCTECRHAKRAEERRIRVERELARVRAGEVLLCRMCHERPRAYTENYVRDYCPECQRLYMANYNDRRRPDSQAAKARREDKS